jgi:pimeloyl-ACP methyl ester carboxylesterase
MFVWGDSDRLVPSRFSRHVASALPDAPQVVLHDCGHVPQVELPEQTHAMIREFIDGAGALADLPREAAGSA